MPSFSYEQVFMAAGTKIFRHSVLLEPDYGITLRLRGQATTLPDMR